MLEPPTVPPSAYDAGYYRRGCLGSTEWSATGGAGVHPAYPYYVDMAGIAAGESLLDVGTGRGELVALAAGRGAARAIGVEYSPDAVALARETIAAHGHPPGAEILLADARSLPLPEASVDVATMFDVVEHLAPHELEAVLAEIRRVLRPGGRLAIHTMPNRLYYDVTWSALRVLRPHWPSEPRNEVERLMHVNEQTRRDLRAALRGAGFTRVRVWYGRWVHDVIIPSPRARRAVRWLARWRLTAPLAAADLWATASRP